MNCLFIYYFKLFQYKSYSIKQRKFYKDHAIFYHTRQLESVLVLVVYSTEMKLFQSFSFNELF